MVTLTIDGQKVSVPKGTKIIEAAKTAGIEIPHLCYDHRIEPFGGCRLCIVEVEGTHELVSSCVTPVEENMVIYTDTPQIVKARRTIIELLLLNHPMDCLVCERCGDCRLQDLAYRLRINFNPFKMDKRIAIGVVTKGIMEINPKKCMHCGLCVRVCREIRMVGAIDFSHRGFKTEIGTPFRKSIDCEYCGQCVSICPVAGVISAMSKYEARVWEIGHSTTICPYCGCGCSLSLNIKTNKIVSISSKEELGINEGNLCAKGRFGYDFPQHPSRLSDPLIRKNGALIKAGWEEALDYAAKRFLEIKEKYGPDSIAGISSGRCTNEENYLFQKFMRVVLGTNNVDNSARLENGATISVLTSQLGYPAMTNPLNDLTKTDTIVVIGANPIESQAVAALKIKAAVSKFGVKLIIIDPRKTKLNHFMHLWFSPNIKTDLYLLNAILKIIISENLFDKKFVQEKTEGFENLKQNLEKLSVKDAARITNISEEDIHKLAKLLGKSKKLCIVYGSGVTQNTQSTEVLKAIVNICLLTGNIGKEGTGLYPLKGYNNSQGACDMGALPDFLPGYQSLDDLTIREKIKSLWHKKLPQKPGYSSHQIYGKIMEGKIKALYIMGDDPLQALPNPKFLQDVFKKIDFLVINDLFLNATTFFAHLVLPVASFVEKEGTYTNMERRIQCFAPAIKPFGNTKTDIEIIGLLSKKLGFELEYSPSKIREEISKLVPIYEGINTIPFPIKGIQWPSNKTNPDGIPILYKNNDTKNKFKIVPSKIPAIHEKTLKNKNYPFILLTGGSLFHSHSGGMSRKSKGLNEVCPEGLVSINPEDARKIGISENEMMQMTSEYGSILAKFHLDNNLPNGVLFAPVHFKEMQINLLFPWQLDPESKSLSNKSIEVKLDKI